MLIKVTLAKVDLDSKFEHSYKCHLTVLLFTIISTCLQHCLNICMLVKCIALEHLELIQCR